jgi:hypothetical protein
MGKIEDIERAVSSLSPDEYARFKAWFEAFEAERFDQRIESDALAGKLDGMAEEALTDLRNGRAREL